MNKNSSIFLAGHKGLVGSAVLDKLRKQGFKKIIVIDKKKVDLRDYKKLSKYFKNKNIDYMIMAAARAGGILANSKFQKDFFFENIEIQNNLLKLALQKKIKRTIYLGTSCIYPKFSKNPIKEDYLLTGKLEKTNQCYAIAKIAGIKLSEVLYEDHNLDIVCLMPTNIYGINDNFDKFSGHVIPAMISKINDAKKLNKSTVKLLGTGKPIREFLFADDLAESILLVLKKNKKKIYRSCKNKFPLINVGSGISISIKNLSKKIAYLSNYKGKIIFDTKYPDGTPKKNLNSRIIKSLGWKSITSLDKGLKKCIDHYVENK
jgi:GDP-L-fucose synthase